MSQTLTTIHRGSAPKGEAVKLQGSTIADLIEEAIARAAETNGSDQEIVSIEVRADDEMTMHLQDQGREQLYEIELETRIM